MDTVKRDKRIIAILFVFTIIFTFFGASLAYWNWETTVSQRTNIVFTLGQNFSCAADGGGDITQADAFIAPSTCTNSEHAIQREVVVTPTMTGSVSSIDMQLWLNVNTMGTGLSESENFKYALTTSSTSCTDGVIESGTFNGTSEGDQVQILNKTYSSSTPQTYYLYIWLDAEETSTSTMDQSFSLSMGGQCDDVVSSSNSSVEQPVIDVGMIPVKLSSNGTVTTVSEDDESWYNYDNKEWANVVLVKNSGTKTRSYYKQNLGVEVNQDDILAYYVWIPRYKYKIWTTASSSKENEQTIDIEFEMKLSEMSLGTVVDEWRTHPAFWWDNNSNGTVDDGETIAGIWVGKFETGHSTLHSTNNSLSCTNENCNNAIGLIIKPNVVSLRHNNISNQFYASRSMTRSGNPFGLSSSRDSHMMKNSEWGAVVYLSHSKYGINSEIYINNSSSYYTGRSGGNVSGSVNTLATQFSDQTSTDKYNSYGYYTWLGEEISSNGTIGSITDSSLGTKASTTGNITGVYDMSGGAAENVMGYYIGANSNYVTDSDSYFGWTSSANSAGFLSLLESKYWDEYTTISNLTACNGGPCYGHALSETFNWYEDTSAFVNAVNPWFVRGDSYSSSNNSSLAGAFTSYNNNGNANYINSWRSVLIVG